MKPRLLILAYHCDPDAGSESGAGWALVRAALEFAECTVIVSSRHLPSLREWKNAHPDVHLEVVGVPRPDAAGWLSRTRLGQFLRYLRWCRTARFTIENLLRREPHDAVWHATYSVYWLPSPIRHLDLPTVWGPVGGAMTTPLPLWPSLGIRAATVEVVDAIAVRAAALAPATRRTWQHATVRIAQNEQTRRRMPKHLRAKTLLLNHAEFVAVPHRSVATETDHLLWFGAVESRKGPALALRALAATDQDVHMKMLGDGPLLSSLRDLASELGIDERVEFHGLVPRNDVMTALQSCRAAVFTGTREEGGLALAEALAYGAPTIVLAHGGPEVIASRSNDARITMIEPGTVEQTVARLASAMDDAWREPLPREGSLLGRDAALETLADVFRRAIETAS